uniref:Uncharacterized protein n=1 Tax=Aegilops tauschii subsp. strangulata TaxID=200361 RepID=A0A453BEA0_AEGTS
MQLNGKFTIMMTVKYVPLLRVMMCIRIQKWLKVCFLQSFMKAVMGNKDNRKLHETFHNEVNGTEDDQMNGGNSNPHDEHDNENFNSAIAPSYLDGMEQEDPGTENGISTPGNQWDSPPERSAGLEKGTPSPARRVSLSVERSPHAHSSEKLDSPHHAKEGDNLADSRSPPARHRSQSPGSPENHDTNRRRAPSHELSPHARDNSPERKAQYRRGDGSPRRRSTSPGRRDGSPQRRSASPKRRDGSPRRRSASPRRRHGSPRREDLHPLKEEMGHLAEDLHPPKEDMGHHDEDLHPLKGGMGHHGEDLHPLKGGMGHHGEDLHLLKEEPRPRGGVHQGGGIPQQGGIPLQEGETHQEREIPHQGGGIPQQGGIPLQEGETHQEREIPLQGGGNPQQERGTPQQGREIDQNQGHHQGKLIPLDIKGSMVDLDQGLHTLGITIEDLQEEGIHQGTDHLQQGIILLKDVGHHLPTGRLDWVSLGGICLLQVLAMPPQSESWRRNLQSLDV